MGAFSFHSFTMKFSLVVLLSVLIFSTYAKTYFSEDFNDDGWRNRWVESKFKGSDAGDWIHTAGDYYLDENDKGIKTGTDYRFYQISAAFDEFTNEGKDLVFQFSIKSEQRLDCGVVTSSLSPLVSTKL